MIARLKGEVIDKKFNALLIDVSGVGYEVNIPLSTFCTLPDVGAQVVLFIHTHVREDALQLFGFSQAVERDLFRLLLAVNGVGPKVAMGILSGITIPELLDAVATDNAEPLGAIPGVGKKTAQRLLLELKDKIISITAGRSRDSATIIPNEILQNDALSALVNLGYKEAPVKRAIAIVLKDRKTAPTLDILLKEALHLLAG